MDRPTLIHVTAHGYYGAEAWILPFGDLRVDFFYLNAYCLRHFDRQESNTFFKQRLLCRTSAYEMLYAASVWMRIGKLLYKVIKFALRGSRCEINLLSDASKGI